jgi:hypothetical protein
MGDEADFVDLATGDAKVHTRSLAPKGDKAIFLPSRRQFSMLRLALTDAAVAMHRLC